MSDQDDEELSAEEIEQEAEEIPKTKENKKPVKQVTEEEEEEEDDDRHEVPVVPDAPKIDKKLLQDLDPNKDLPPTRRYAPKPKKVIIPFVIPWENSAAIRTQKGMGAFGASRNAITAISGTVEYKDGDLKPENVLSKFAQTNIFESRSGMKAFGAHRNNITKFKSSKEMDPDRIQASEGIIPKQAGALDLPSQKGTTPIGSIRRQTPLITYGEMDPNIDPLGDSFVSRYFSINPNNKAGTGVIDTRRKHVMEIQGSAGHVPETEGLVPKFFDRKDLDHVKGTGAGTFGLGRPRNVITEVEDEFPLNEYEVRESGSVLPWATSATLHSQQGTGGFNKVRDVVTNVDRKW